MHAQSYKHKDTAYSKARTHTPQKSVQFKQEKRKQKKKHRCKETKSFTGTHSQGPEIVLAWKTTRESHKLTQ